MFDVPRRAVSELTPGSAIIVSKAGQVSVTDVLGEAENQRCSFERIYFSRGSDADIYRERKQLGRNVVPAIMESIDNDLAHSGILVYPKHG